MDRNRDDEATIDETTCLPKIIESHGFVYEDRFKTIERITAEFDGFSKEYFVSNFGEKAAVLAIKGNNVLLVRQYRLLINRLSYEVPGGKVNEGENPEEAAIRECVEETGVRCKKLEPLIEYDLDLEYTRNHTYVFYSDDLDDPSGQFSEKHIWLPMNECLEMIFDGQISDSLSIISILAKRIQESFK